MSSAHIFYIPVILLVGVFAGYYVGRWAAEQEEIERRKRLKRRQKLEEAAANKTAD